MRSQNFKVAMYVALMTSFLYTSYVNADQIYITIVNRASSYDLVNEGVFAQRLVKPAGVKMYYHDYFTKKVPPGGTLNIGAVPKSKIPGSFIQIIVQSKDAKGNNLAQCVSSLDNDKAISGAQYYFNVQRFPGNSMKCWFFKSA